MSEPTSGRPSQADTPMLDADEGDGDPEAMGATIDLSGTDGRPGPEERSEDVRQAEAEREAEHEDRTGPDA